MFGQLALAALGSVILAIGVIEMRLFDLILGLGLLLSAGSMFYAARSGSSVGELFDNWLNSKKS